MTGGSPSPPKKNQFPPLSLSCPCGHSPSFRLFYFPADSRLFLIFFRIPVIDRSRGFPTHFTTYSREKGGGGGSRERNPQEKSFSLSGWRTVRRDSTRQKHISCPGIWEIHVWANLSLCGKEEEEEEEALVFLWPVVRLKEKGDERRRRKKEEENLPTSPIPFSSSSWLNGEFLMRL